MATMKNDVDAGKVAMIGVVGTLLVLSLVFVVQGFFYTMDRHDREKKAGGRRAYSVYLSEQVDRLEHYKWVDREKGVVQVPIERAMELEIQRAANKTLEQVGEEEAAK